MRRYIYARKSEPFLGNIIGEWFTRKFHNAKTIADVATAGVTLKLMSRDIEKNGASGGAMSVTEAVGVPSSTLLSAQLPRPLDRIPS